MPTLNYLNLPFEKQLEYFRQKKAIPAETLKEVESSYHDWAFSVTGLTRADLVRDLMALVDRSIAEGMTHEEFQQQFYRLIGRKGWTPVEIDRTAPQEVQLKQLAANNRRLYTILDTNHRRSHGAGRLKQIRQPHIMKARPYIQWIHRDSRVPRPHHLALDGKVFPADREFWLHCFPPNGYGCRCGVKTLSKKDLKRLNLEVSEPPPWEDFVEPGFENSAGVSQERDRARLIEQGLSKQSESLRAILESELSE